MSDTDEQIILVDEDDSVIGHKSRISLSKSDRTRVSVIWVQNSQGQVLLARRSKLKKFDPLCWGPAAAGTVEKGESYLQNAQKELKEEIGLDNVELKEIGKLRWDGANNHLCYCTYFKAICDWPIEQFTLQKNEVDSIRWISKKELLDEIEARPDTYTPNALKTIQLLNLVD